MLEKLSNVVEKTDEFAKNLKTSVIDHLQSLEIECQWYFSELKEEDAISRNQFSTSLAIANILMKYRTNFVIFGIIHQHMIFLMKCNFLGSGELCVNYIHNCLNWLSEYCFRCHSTSLREWFHSSSSHQNGGTKSNYSRAWQKVSTVKHLTTNFEVGHTSIFVVKNVVIVCCIVLEQHFPVIIMVIMSYVPVLQTE